jgi:hypothetical protein
LTNDSTASRAESPSQAGFRRSLLRAWWPATAWIVLIGFESTDFFSSENTGTALYTILSRLFGHIDIGEFFVFHHILRKTGHVVGYGTLSLLLLRGWRATFGYRPDLLLRAALLSWLGTAFVAAMDRDDLGCRARYGGRGRFSGGRVFLVAANLRRCCRSSRIRLSPVWCVL